MVSTKLVAVVVFCLVALVVSFFVPLFTKAWSVDKKPPRTVPLFDISAWYLNLAIIIGLIVILALRAGVGFSIAALILGLLVGFLNRPKLLAGTSVALLGILIASYLPWWRTSGYQITLSIAESLSILGVTGLMFFTLSWPLKIEQNPNHKTEGTLAPKQWLLFAAFLAVVVVFVPYKGLILDHALLTTWHHWGAYIGPARLVIEGVYPLHDIPIQYGFGPTLVAAIGCVALDCWNGFYWLNVGFVICFFATLAYATLLISKGASLLAQVAIMISLATCALGWTMYPPDLISPLATPSTSGMRFLPGALMMSFLVHFSLVSAQSEMTRRTQVLGHSLWALGLFWSPEAAIHTTFLWGPFFVWYGVFYARDTPSIRLFWKQIRILVGVLLAALAVFILGYVLVYQKMPLWTMYTASLRNPPGVLPINFRETIWVALACFTLWFVSLWASHQRGTTDSHTMTSWVTMLFALVTFTYFLGRSHSNNALNLLPYFALMLIALRSARTSWAVRQIANILLASVVGWSVIFGLNFYKKAQSAAGYLAYQNTSLTERMTYQDSENVMLFTEYRDVNSALAEQKDLREALHYIKEIRDEPVEIFDLNMLVDASSKYGPWSAVHPIATTFFSSSAERQLYLRNVMQRLDREGWIIISNAFALPSIVDDYDTVYDQTEKMAFGTYTAIRYAPKLDPITN